MSAVRRQRRAPAVLLPALLPALLLAPVLAAAALLSPPLAPAASAAIPATCGMLDLTDTAAVETRADGTDDVFVGRVVDLTRGRTATDPITHSVVVEETVTGDLSAGREVRVLFSQAKGEPTQLRLNQSYLLFTRDDESALLADGCEGYTSARSLDAARIEELREALAPVEETPDVVLSEPDGGSDGPPDLGRVLAPGAAISLLGVLGLALISRVGRRRR